MVKPEIVYKNLRSMLPYILKLHIQEGSMKQIYSLKAQYNLKIYAPEWSPELIVSYPWTLQ